MKSRKRISKDVVKSLLEKVLQGNAYDSRLSVEDLTRALTQTDRLLAEMGKPPRQGLVFHLRNIKFDMPVTLTATTIPHILYFERCTFKSGMRLNNSTVKAVHFKDCIFYGTLCLENATVESHLQAEDVVFYGENCVCEGGHIRSGEASPEDANSGQRGCGQGSCTACPTSSSNQDITDDQSSAHCSCCIRPTDSEHSLISIYARDMEVGGCCILRNCKILHEAFFAGAEIGGVLDLTGTIFFTNTKWALFAPNLEVRGSVYLREVCCVAASEASAGISFDGAIIGGKIDADCGRLFKLGSLFIRNANVRGAVIFHSRKFYNISDCLTENLHALFVFTDESNKIDCFLTNKCNEEWYILKTRLSKKQEGWEFHEDGKIKLVVKDQQQDKQRTDGSRSISIEMTLFEKKVTRTLEFRQTVGGFHGEVDFSGSDIESSVQFAHCHLTRGIRMYNCRIAEDLIFGDGTKLGEENNTDNRTEVYLAGTHVDGTVSFGEVKSYARIIASNLVVGNDLSLRVESPRENEYHYHSYICLSGARIGGNLDLRGACLGYEHADFRNKNEDIKYNEYRNLEYYALYAPLIEVRGNVYLGNGFTCEGAVNFAAAEIEGNLDCRGGNFKHRGERCLYLSLIQVGRTAFFGKRNQNDECGIAGGILLTGAHIRGELNLNGASISAECSRFGVAARSITVDLNLRMSYDEETSSQFCCSKGVILDKAVVKGDLDCRGGWFWQDSEVSSHSEGDPNSAGAQASSPPSNPDASLGQIDGHRYDEGIFDYSLHAEGIKVYGSVYLGHYKHENRLVSSAFGRGVNFALAMVEVLFDCTSGLFNHGGDRCLYAPQMEVGRRLILEGVETKGIVNISSAKIRGDLDCAGAQLGSALHRRDQRSYSLLARGAKIEGSVYLNETSQGHDNRNEITNSRKFKAESMVNFGGSDIGGRFVLVGILGQKNRQQEDQQELLKMSASKVSWNVEIKQSEIYGTVKMNNATISGNVECYETQISGDFKAPHMEVSDSVYFREEPRHLARSIDLSGSLIRGQLLMEHVSVGTGSDAAASGQTSEEGQVSSQQREFEELLNITAVKVGGDVKIIDTTVKGHLQVSDASVDGNLEFIRTRVNGSLRARSTKVGKNVKLGEEISQDSEPVGDSRTHTGDNQLHHFTVQQEIDLSDSEIGRSLSVNCSFKKFTLRNSSVKGDFLFYRKEVSSDSTTVPSGQRSEEGQVSSQQDSGESFKRIRIIRNVILGIKESIVSLLLKCEIIRNLLTGSGLVSLTRFVSNREVTIDLSNSSVFCWDDRYALGPQSGNQKQDNYVLGVSLESIRRMSQYELGGFTYQNLGDSLQEKVDKNPKSLGVWINFSKGCEYQPQPYEHMATILKREGKEIAWAEIIRAKRRELRQQQFNLSGKDGIAFSVTFSAFIGLLLSFNYSLSFAIAAATILMFVISLFSLHRLLYLFFDLLLVDIPACLSARPWRASFYASITLLAFSLLYSFETWRMSNQWVSPLETLRYAVDRMVPFVRLGTEWKPPDVFWLPWSDAFLTSIGIYLITIIIGTITGFIKTEKL